MRVQKYYPCAIRCDDDGPYFIDAAGLREHCIRVHRMASDMLSYPITSEFLRFLPSEPNMEAWLLE